MAQWVRAQGVASAVWPGRSLRASMPMPFGTNRACGVVKRIHQSPERERRDTGWLGETASAWQAGRRGTRSPPARAGGLYGEGNRRAEQDWRDCLRWIFHAQATISGFIVAPRRSRPYAVDPASFPSRRDGRLDLERPGGGMVGTGRG